MALARICILTNLLSLAFYAIKRAHLSYLTVLALLVESRQEFKHTCYQVFDHVPSPAQSVIIMLIILFVIHAILLAYTVTVLLLVFASAVIIIQDMSSLILLAPYVFKPVHQSNIKILVLQYYWPWNANCLRCNGNLTNCTTCAFYTAVSQL